MTAPRPHPFALIFGPLVETHFPAIREALGPAPARDTFLMAEPVLTLLGELRPDDGLGDDGGGDFLALVHAAYRYWADGEITRTLSEDQTRALCAVSAAPRLSLPERARYIQIAPRLIWGSLDGGEQHEPLDGWFSLPEGDQIGMTALFGVHPERPGVSVIAVAGSRPEGTGAREDGSPLFAPTMTGGDRAGLHAVASAEELLLLAWRAADGNHEGE